MKHIKALLDFARTTPGNLFLFAKNIFTKLYGNAAYPNPPVGMATFKAVMDRLEVLNTAALDGGKKIFAERRAVIETMVEMLRQLAHYVEGASKGEEVTFRSSGFVPAPTTRTKTAPWSEAIRKIRPGDNSGTVLVTLVCDPEANGYQLRWIPAGSEATDAWSMMLIALTRPATLVKNLTPGTTYVFQVRAVRSGGVTDWSDPVRYICQ